MIRPGYSGIKENPLSLIEGVGLTIELGRSHAGDDYDNADVYGRILHFGGGGYLGARLIADKEEFISKIDTQVDRVQKIIAPYIGRWATAKHRMLGVKNEGEWQLWQRSHGDADVMHTSGIILGAAGVAMNSTMTFHWDHPDEVSKAYEAHAGQTFKIGVLLDTTYSSPAFSYGVEAPDTDEMLVPVRGFPGSREGFSGLWSWQIGGTDNK